MRNKEDQGYRNPAYIYDEGRGGGGPDSRSGSSTSSKSSMKIISTKLKGQGRRRWLTLALILVIAIVIIIAVTTAIYFTRNNNKGSSTGNGGEFQHTITIETSTSVPNTTTKPVSTAPPTSKLTSTLSVSTKTTKPTTKQHVTSATISATTTTTASTTTQSSTLQTSQPTTRRTTTTTVVTTTTSATTSTTSSVNTQPSTNITIVSSTKDPTNNKSGNLSVTMSDILYHPDEVKSVTLRCEGRHQGDWRTLTIRRQFKDGYEPVGVAVLNEENEVEVFKFYPNVTHVISIVDNDVTLTLTFDPFLCAELTNFTCAMANAEETATTRANISIYMPEPVITLPHAIVEDRKISLRCVTEVWGSDATVVWKFKPEYNTKFMDFSVQPANNITRKNCSTVINSSLEFNPTMYEDGADFRCEIKDQTFHPQVIQETSSDVTLKVVPSTYCEGKRQFTIHPHPHGPCTLVVYCLDTGPLVYEIECEPGHCYDYVKTACVPENTL
ncbi:uncharacterized protein LOC123522909 [Mercenaria mercenaria]|uniref:uncharacterized protein LOC123522909 n=1 Tax=Mercenaria mercenaria TaxID=6596 RepID=UPI00234F6E8F|nr:uncharacterized protein LOC123522909 [Mercenaria mercenaria]